MAKTPKRAEDRDCADKSHPRLAGGLSNLVIVELFVAAIAIGFVAAMLALAQVIILTGIANKGHW